MSDYRISIPSTWKEFKYLLKNPRDLFGKYDHKSFIWQRDLILKQQSDIIKLEDSVRQKNGKLSVLGKELSKLKRDKT